MQRLVLMIVILLSLTIVSASHGQTPGKEPGEVTVLTLGDACKITLERNRDIQSALEVRKQVKGFYIEQRAAALPQLSFNANASRSFDGVMESLQRLPRQDNRVVELTLSQVIFTWGQVGAAIRAAEFSIAGAEDQLRIAKQAALLDTTSTFYDILMARELHAIAKQNVKQRTAHMDQARKRHALGVATDYDVLAAEVAVENARPDVIRAENAIVRTKDNLAFLLGLTGQEIDVEGDLFTAVELGPAYEEVLETAHKKRPELSGIRNRLEIAKELVKVAAGFDKPRLVLGASAGWKDMELSSAMRNLSFRQIGAIGGLPILVPTTVIGEDRFKGKTWAVGLFMTFPFFDGFATQGKVVQAKSEVASRRIDEAKLLDGIALEARVTVNGVRESAGIVQALSGTVTEAEKLLSMAEKGYEFGVKTRLEVEDAQLNVSRARGGLAQAHRNYLVARTALKKAMGVLGEEGK